MLSDPEEAILLLTCIVIVPIIKDYSHNHTHSSPTFSNAKPRTELYLHVHEVIADFLC